MIKIRNNNIIVLIMLHKILLTKENLKEDPKEVTNQIRKLVVNH